jgi:hypothetical protein
MAQPPSVGTLSKWGAGASSVDHAFEYTNFTIGKRQAILSTDGIRGTRAHPVERTRAGLYTVGGNVTFNPGSADLTFWLPYILGSGGAIAETVSAFKVGIDRISAMYTYAGCKVDRATFSASMGDFLSLSLDIEGLTETAGSITGFSALVASLAVPYVFMDGTLTIGGTTYQVKAATVSVDNHLKKDRYMNSISRTDLPELDRTVSLALTLPYTSDTLALYDTGAASAAVVLAFANGVTTITLTMAACSFPAQGIDTPGRDEILLPLTGRAYRTGTTAEITQTNV